MRKQQGQTVLILVLVMAVALSIGISVVQRSISDVSTATKVEQSSRAFSAAEAGIEKYINQATSCAPGACNIQFSENNSAATIEGGGLIPVVPAEGTRQEPLEYPPLAKEETAQVWLADYTNSSPTPPAAYTQNSLDVYWGNSSTDKAALELTLVYYESSQYKTKKWYFDHASASRNPANNFDTTANCAGVSLGSNSYQCKITISSLPASPAILMLLRARLLYNTTSQPFAVQARETCGPACSLPPQVVDLTSTGTSGQAQRKVRLFQINNVVPPYFDYGIFSTSAINK